MYFRGTPRPHAWAVPCARCVRSTDTERASREALSLGRLFGPRLWAEWDPCCRGSFERETEGERARREEEEAEGTFGFPLPARGNELTANVWLLFCLGAWDQSFITHTRSTFRLPRPSPCNFGYPGSVIETASPSIWTSRE